MNVLKHPATPLRGLLTAVFCLSGGVALVSPHAVNASTMVAVDSDVSRDYVRSRLPDGTLQPEGYVFGKGGSLPGIMADDSIDSMDFLTVAHTVAPTLAKRKYVSSQDPQKTRLLIMVYWGTTQGTVDLGFTPEFMMPFSASYMMQNRVRDQIDHQNAELLGYTADGLIGTDEGYWMQTSPGAFRYKVLDEINEVELSRYFVVLMAYDFQMMWKEKKPKLLWVTRLSIDERRNDFVKELPAMLRIASPYFGRSTKGLLRNAVPEGRVDVGDVKSLGVEPEK
jgi:hypothetical protein